LQTIIDNYSRNINSKAFNNLMELTAPCINLTSGRCDIITNQKYVEIINTNLNIIEENEGNAKYVMYLHMDFAEGKIDKGKDISLNCNYKDTLLTNQFNELFNKKNEITMKPLPFVTLKGRKQYLNKPEETPQFPPGIVPPSEEMQESEQPANAEDKPTAPFGLPFAYPQQVQQIQNLIPQKPFGISGGSKKKTKNKKRKINITKKNKKK